MTLVRSERFYQATEAQRLQYIDTQCHATCQVTSVQAVDEYEGSPVSTYRSPIALA